MNMGSKAKKRVVLPSRPEPPTVEQILEDVNRAAPNDPVFTVLEESNQVLFMRVRDPDALARVRRALRRKSNKARFHDASGGSRDDEVETKYLQSRRYLELNEQLQDVRVSLVRQREELRTAGEQLEGSVAEVKGRAVITSLPHGTAHLEIQE